MFIKQQATQLGMASKTNPEQVEDFALEPTGNGPNRHD
jgi:hypothetical protein